MSWSQLVLILMCAWAGILLVLLIRQEKKRKRLLLELDLLLVEYTLRSKVATLQDARMAFTVAGCLLEELLLEEEA